MVNLVDNCIKCAMSNVYCDEDQDACCVAIDIFLRELMKTELAYLDSRIIDFYLRANIKNRQMLYDAMKRLETIWSEFE
jgi:hypothetical protein